MNEPKPFAALSSGLLARKGHAKPAMRPQTYGGFGDPHDDLGWNDMGAEAAAAARQPAPEPRPAPPPVADQQAMIARQFAAEPPGPQDDLDEEAATASLDAGMVSLARGEGRGKAAFTLRLDAERHLKLRLACALRNRSAQQIVTEALDALLEGIPNLDAMADAAAAGDTELVKGRVGK